MFIKAPKIDGRSQKDLIDLTKELMVHYCPEWVDKAEIKPGQMDDALIQVFARMTDIVIQRLNRVPDKNFLAFLDLMGIRLSPPHVARAPLSFTMAKGTSQYGFVPAGTQVAGETKDKKEVIFETEEDLTVILPKLVKAVSIEPQNDCYTDHSSVLFADEQSQTETLFMGSDPVPHRLYLGHDTLFGFKEETTITLDVTLKKAVEINDWEIQWYCHTDDITEPKLLTPDADNDDVVNLLKSGSISFKKVSGVAEQTLTGFEKQNGLEKSWTSYWIFAELSKPIDKGLLPEIDSIEAAVAIKPIETVKLDLALFNDSVIDLTRDFRPFGEKPELNDTFYIGSREVFSKTGTIITILVRLSTSSVLSIRKIKLFWEFYNGKEWIKIGETSQRGVATADPQPPYSFTDTTKAFTCNGQVEFTCPAVGSYALNGEENYWIRVRIVDGNYGDRILYRAPSIKVFDIQYAFQLPPDLAFFNAFPIDLTKDFCPFGEKPKFNDTFYLGSTEVFAKKDAIVTIPIALSDENSPDTDDIKLVWEFCDGKKWTRIGETTRQGVPIAAAQTPYSFTDTTNAFTCSGQVGFICPAVVAYTLNGEENYWIRVRIVGGNYGDEATYQEQTVNGKYKVIVVNGTKKKMVKGVAIDLDVEEDGTVEKTEWIYVPATYQWPSIKSLGLEYELKPAYENLKTVLTYNDFLYEDQSEKCNTAGETFAPFEAGADQEPTLYLAFDQDIGTLPVNLFFPLERALISAMQNTQTQSSPIAAWEYWNGKAWSALSVEDKTLNLTKPEMIQFLAPDDVSAGLHFENEYYWIRARQEEGQYATSPKLKAIYGNTVWAHNRITLADEILGSSNGKPDQSFQFAHYPILSGQEVLVRETALTEEERRVILAEEGKDAVTEVKDEAENITKIWVRWHEVVNFYFSEPGSRHYTLDRNTGTVVFGDGVRGLIPPAGKDNIQCGQYQYGGGEKGNVAAQTLTKLRTTFPYVDSVTNPVKAEGGCDMEDLDHVRIRGPQTIKNRQRAVTYEDFEWLVREASPKTAKVKCLPTTDTGLKFRPGWITLIVVPESDEDKPLPSQELLSEIEEYLFTRASTYLTVNPSQINLLGPGYIKVGSEASVAFTSLNQAKIIEGRIMEALQTFFHPLQGGAEGKGWDFGRDVPISEVYEVIEKIEGVDYVKDLVLKASAQIYTLQLKTNIKLAYKLPDATEVKSADDKICFALAEMIPANVETKSLGVTGFKEGDLIVLSHGKDSIRLTIEFVAGDILECMPLLAETSDVTYPPQSVVTTADNRIRSYTLNEVSPQSASFFLKTAVFESNDKGVLHYQDKTVSFEPGGISDRVETVFIDDHYLVYSGSHFVNRTTKEEPVFPYMFNLHTKELHDLENENPNCKISKTLREHRQFLRIMDKAYLQKKKMDYCRWCFGKDMSTR